MTEMEDWIQLDDGKTYVLWFPIKMIHGEASKECLLRGATLARDSNPVIHQFIKSIGKGH